MSEHGDAYQMEKQYWGSDYYYAEGVSQCAGVKCRRLIEHKPVHSQALQRRPKRADFERVVTTFYRVDQRHFLALLESHREYVYYVGKSMNEVTSRFGGFAPGDIHSYASVVYWLSSEDCHNLTEGELIEACEEAGQCEYNVVAGSDAVCENYYLISDVYRTITMDQRRYYDKFRTPSFVAMQTQIVLNKIEHL